MTASKRKYFGRKKKIDLTFEEKFEIQNYQTRFSKWHTSQIDLLTFSINLIFTISIALLGFLVNAKLQDSFKDNLILGNYSLIKTSLYLLTISLTSGLFALFSRLNDFRLTKNKVAVRRRIYELKNDLSYEDCAQSSRELEEKSLDMKTYWSTFLGRATWIFFYLQVFILLLMLWIIVITI